MPVDDDIRAAIIDGSKVINVVLVADNQTAVDNGWVVSTSAKIGDTYDPGAGTFTSPSGPTAEELLQEERQGMVVSRRQFIHELIIEGMDEDVDPIINTIADPIEQKLMWAWYKESQVFERTSPELIQMATAMGKTALELDDFFRAADLL